jgi:hypothetical protein
MAIARLNSFYRTNDKLDSDDKNLPDEFLARMGFTREQTEREIYGPGKKPGGGQLGNANALRHGFYASIFKPAELLKLDKLQQNEIDDELAFIRTLIKRMAALLDEQTGLGWLEYLRAMRVITCAGACVERLECTKKCISPEPSWFDHFLVAVRKANKEQGVA